ncbi:SGNH/GDSL hydrolase family protein [Gordonia sp. TBRC 11910]|uniref:SGNH/GDSL hydrolase family protein n=1 Tax=Gordonia asplenii TaxID=2725283 RepID=A0A848KYY2_9ACTN|nr:SGNH/GDSL hydrolase family protein [Gordonia asplenii]NMO03910.1 SGNH/GDSL hydrolase family protein [Gordonia asplenii]
MRRLLIAAVAVAALTIGGCAPGTGPGPSSSRQTAPTTSAQTTPAEPTSAAYVHLGDSYAAGSGVTPLVEDSDLLCLRSQRNFGEIIAAQRHSQYPTFRDVACAGATTADLSASQHPGVAPQLDALGPDTRLVTLMLGGNDGGTFGSAVADCSGVVADDPAGSPCRSRYGSRFADYVTTTTRPALVRALAAIRGRAPSARVVIVGYPWLLPPTSGCYPTMRIATGDVGYLRTLQATLDDAARAAAAQTGATFVSMATVSEGHDACAGAQRRWVEPMVGATTTVTLHPNAAGQRALAAATLAALGS